MLAYVPIHISNIKILNIVTTVNNIMIDNNKALCFM